LAVVFADPPYNVRIDGNVSGLGATRHDDFAMASGEMSAAEFEAFLRTSLGLAVAHSVDGAIHFVCMDWRHQPELLAAASSLYNEQKNLCVWNKTNAGMGSLYRSKHEFVFVFKVGSGPHINNVELGRHGRNRTNVWDYPSQNAMGVTKSKLSLHPTVKPVALVADAIRDCSNRNGIVLDPFGGAGTTLIAAEKTGRAARLIEVEPRYVDASVLRWQRLTGERAISLRTGGLFGHGQPAFPDTPGASCVATSTPGGAT
jgi:DNA modification methylase